MADDFYNVAYVLIALQIGTNALFLVFTAVVLATNAYRGKDLGDEKIDVLNGAAFAGFSLVVGIILMKLLLNGSASSFLLMLASFLTGFIKWPVDHFYRKRNPPPAQLETKDRYLPNTTAQTFLEEAQLLAEKQNKAELASDKH